MKNKIQHFYPSISTQTFNDAEVYVADFSERTNSARGVEFHPSHPSCPKTEGQLMDCLLIRNPKGFTLSFVPFENQLFKDEQGNDMEQCECCFFPLAINTIDNNFISFVEIKDCKSKNISIHKDKAISQLTTSIREFRRKEIICDKQRMYGIISFPRMKKLYFNQTLIEDYTEYKRLYKQEKIHLLITNEVTVVSGEKIVY
ncbi:MAG: hypothetical protein IKY31_02540 [Bacteroidaceae bacterium]|nr:hypothetical protein [Bacteroidaceae bacterium]